MTASKHQTDFLESYAVWRITYQSSEQAARAAYARVQELEAQRIADWKTGQPDYRTVPQAQWREAEDAASKYRMEADSLRDQLADLTRKSMKRIIELESQLEAIGAGGVEPLRRRECLHQIVEPAPATTEKPVAGCSECYITHDLGACDTATPAAVAEQGPVVHDEELLEQMYWEFDGQRRRTGEERLAFKVKMRSYASEFRRRSDGKMTFAQSVSDDMMNLADRLGSEYDDVDPRAWKHLLVYAPKAAPAAVAGPSEAETIIRALLDHIERNTCEHHETYRGGAIWEICSACGAKWADDEGGKPTFEWPAPVERAREFLLAAPTTQPAPADPLDTPLPCDLTAGGVTIGKGCPLRTVQLRLQVQADANALLLRRTKESLAAKPAPAAQGDAPWMPASEPPPESEGEVLVRMADGRCEIAWATYWHGSSNAFAQWTFRYPDEEEQPVEWMRIPAARSQAKKGGA